MTDEDIEDLLQTLGVPVTDWKINEVKLWLIEHKLIDE